MVGGSGSEPLPGPNNVIILCKVSPFLTSGPAIPTVWAAMNTLSYTSAAPTASRSAGATRGRFAFAFFYRGYAYFYFPSSAGDT